MVNTCRINVRCKKTLKVLHFSQKAKTIPNVIFGIKASPPMPGMEGMLDWLMSKCIHKYWPFFSNLTYTEMISLRDENLDWYMNSLGAQGTFCQGARRKILKSLEELRSRSSQIKVIDHLDVEKSCRTISSVLKTPISDSDMEEDGTFLTGLIMEKITLVVDVCKKTGSSVNSVAALLREYIECKSVHEYDKICAKSWLNGIKLDFFQRRKYGRRTA
ncbi:uncharacterized protein LOC106673692 [Cimex lectularius]|uniref:Uncharacterized protein n=1 Tax=Cimex lectularius TaxID=79782 RepID=A0A8I6TLE1_CIMLE|nr:uncharacterized protein LOC106673692 [Cimex lectularius]